ncbi:MAG TPA: hypothetical protein PK768_05055 [Tepidanaerobacteraceae bacterium]|jgi:hypothetical protein|nr:hypothetical protein [Tepidanaerobacteraceae bacterium]
MNLFGEEFEQPAENACGAAAAKAPKKGKKASTPAKKDAFEEKLPQRNIQVKMYSDFYSYEAPAELAEPTLDDVRKWLINNHGFTELADPKRVGMFIVTPEGQDPYVYCGVKFEKMG